MVKEMDRTTGFNSYNDENYDKPADFGKNEIVVYRGSRIGRAIVALMGGIVILNIILCFVSVGMFSKSIRMNNEAIAQSRELIEAISVQNNHAEEITEGKNTSVSEAKTNETVETTREDIVVEDTDSKEEKKQTKPISDSSTKLSAMKMVSSNGVKISDQCQNTLGDTYSNAILGIEDKETWVTYYLDGKYSSLLADLSVYENYWVNETPYIFEIYTNNDENSVIYTTTLSRLSTVEHLDVDVTGAEFITIRARFNGYSQKPTFILAGAELNK